MANRTSTDEKQKQQQQQDDGGTKTGFYTYRYCATLRPPPVDVARRVLLGEPSENAAFESRLGGLVPEAYGTKMCVRKWVAYCKALGQRPVVCHRMLLRVNDEEEM